MSHRPKSGLPAPGTGADASGGDDEAAWLAADQDWLLRAQKGTGVAGGPEKTKTAVFYANGYTPYGKDWGAFVKGADCASPSPSLDPCASPDPSASVDPSATIDPLATPLVCPSPADSGSPLPSDTGLPTPTPSLEPATPTPPTPTPGLTAPPTGSPAPAAS